MSNERALTIVEAAQLPQVVAVSDVSKDEIEYQRAFRQCKDLMEQLAKTGDIYIKTQTSLIKAWMAENYPGVAYTVTPTTKADNREIFIGTATIIESPASSVIHQELNAYLDQLTA